MLFNEIQMSCLGLEDRGKTQWFLFKMHLSERKRLLLCEKKKQN